MREILKTIQFNRKTLRILAESEWTALNLKKLSPKARECFQRTWENVKECQRITASRRKFTLRQLRKNCMPLWRRKRLQFRAVSSVTFHIVDQATSITSSQMLRLMRSSISSNIVYEHIKRAQILVSSITFFSIVNNFLKSLLRIRTSFRIFGDYQSLLNPNVILTGYYSKP